MAATLQWHRLCPIKELNLGVTLRCGQSFIWHHHVHHGLEQRQRSSQPQGLWTGVVGGNLVSLKENHVFDVVEFMLHRTSADDVNGTSTLTIGTYILPFDKQHMVFCFPPYTCACLHYNRQDVHSTLCNTSFQH